MKSALNIIGPQVRKFRVKKCWSQATLAVKLQLLGWSASRDTVANLEMQRRRVSDCEIVFLAKVLDVKLEDLIPRYFPFKQIGPQFQSGERLTLFPTRGEK